MSIGIFALAIATPIADGPKLSIELVPNRFEISCLNDNKEYINVSVTVKRINSTMKTINKMKYIVILNNSNIKISYKKDKKDKLLVWNKFGISGYRGNHDIEFFNVKSNDESLIYWREITLANAFEFGLLRFENEDIFEVCRGEALIRSS